MVIFQRSDLLCRLVRKKSLALIVISRLLWSKLCGPQLITLSGYIFLWVNSKTSFHLWSNVKFRLRLRRQKHFRTNLESWFEDCGNPMFWWDDIFQFFWLTGHRFHKTMEIIIMERNLYFICTGSSDLRTDFNVVN